MLKSHETPTDLALGSYNCANSRKQYITYTLQTS
jgi:hypothetical protein